MDRTVGTIARGIRTPIIREGDSLARIVVDSVLGASKAEGFSLRDRDVVAVTESVVARSQGNYASVEAIATDVREKFGGGAIGVVFPILSRNRFATCLRGIAMAAETVVLMLSYPRDEVGNQLLPLDLLDETDVNPYSDVLDLPAYRAHFGATTHPFTGVDYVSYYEDVITRAGAKAQIIFANNPKAILNYTDRVLACDIHSRARTKRILRAAGAKIVYGLDDILTSPVDGSGYNEQFGLLGANMATEDSVKLFPRDCGAFVRETQALLAEATGKHMEVMVFGDGAFKDPQCHIWELADPCVSPAYTDGLRGTPHELKLKYFADNEFKHLTGDALKEAVTQAIRDKTGDFADDMASLGTTPRHFTDLIGSLSDLTSGSGDKGTPVVLVQGYFDDYTAARA
ncbi:MAG: coenzyme F420-0:L-glutamate ligase [Christensenellales bacterium]|jgi:hypothetical protein